MPAGAEDPKPEPCEGVTVIADPSGDQMTGPMLGGPPQAQETGPENLDVKKVWINSTKGSDGKPSSKVGLQIANLTKEVPEEARTGAVMYYVDFATTEGIRYVRALLKDTGVTYHYGIFGDTAAGPGTGASEELDTTGQFIEGPDGVIEIDLPAEIAKPGTKLADFYVDVAYVNDMNEVWWANDSAPDDGLDAAFEYTIKECPAAGATATATATATAGATATATPPPNNGGGSGTQPARPAQPNPGQGQPATPATPAQPAKRPARKAKSCKAKAKKIKNKRKRAKALKRCKKAGKRR